MSKLISVVTACYNEEENVEALSEAVKGTFAKLPQYQYEHIFIDNGSKDKTPQILKAIAARDKNIKVILNTRNFGHIRSPYHGLLQARGQAVISLVADFQDPPDMIPELLKKWEEGCQVVIGVKKGSEESLLMYAIRKFYYYLINTLSDTPLVKNFTGFGLYDQKVIHTLRQIDDPYPYFRGLVMELGFSLCQIPYLQKARRRGITKNNFYTLYDMAMLGITNHSKVPLRLATMIGFAASAVGLMIGFIFLILKLIYWQQFVMGTAPLLISVFVFSSIQLFFIGILGEYIGSIHTQVLKRPLVIERERINFD